MARPRPASTRARCSFALLILRLTFYIPPHSDYSLFFNHSAKFIRFEHWSYSSITPSRAKSADGDKNKAKPR